IISAVPSSSPCCPVPIPSYPGVLDGSSLLCSWHLRTGNLRCGRCAGSRLLLTRRLLAAASRARRTAAGPPFSTHADLDLLIVRQPCDTAEHLDVPSRVDKSFRTRCTWRHRLRLITPALIGVFVDITISADEVTPPCNLKNELRNPSCSAQKQLPDG